MFKRQDTEVATNLNNKFVKPSFENEIPYLEEGEVDYLDEDEASDNLKTQQFTVVSIYNPAEDSFLMSNILRENLPSLLEKNKNLKFLEIGTGSNSLRDPRKGVSDF